MSNPHIPAKLHIHDRHCSLRPERATLTWPIKPDEPSGVRDFPPRIIAQSADGFSPEGRGVMDAPKVPGNADNRESHSINKRLLVLEDEPSVMRSIRHMLRRYSIIEASTAEQALRLFIDHGRCVDLLLADVTLPTSSGIQVALLLRSEIRRLPVILISGYPVSGWCRNDSADLDRLGSNSVAIFQKPFQVQGLLRAVRRLTGTALSESEGTA
jgi:CheY-like chemotaxis protein